MPWKLILRNIWEGRAEIKKKFEEFKVSDEFLLRILQTKKDNAFKLVKKNEYYEFEENYEESKVDTFNFCQKPKKLEIETEEETKIFENKEINPEKLILNVEMPKMEEVPEENKHFDMFSEEKENVESRDFNDKFSLFLPKEYEEQTNDYASNMRTFNENENGTNFAIFKFDRLDSEFLPDESDL